MYNEYHQPAGVALYEPLPVLLRDPQHWIEVKTEVILGNVDLVGIQDLDKAAAPDMDVAEELTQELTLLPAHGASEDRAPELRGKLGVDFRHRRFEGGVVEVFPGKFSVGQTLMTLK